MANKLAVSAATNYGTPTTLTAQLATLHSAVPLSQIVTGRLTTTDVAAHVWAQQNGVPWLCLNAQLDAAGKIDPASRALALLGTNADQLVIAGSSAHTTAASAVAVVKGKTVTAV